MKDMIERKLYPPKPLRRATVVTDGRDYQLVLKENAVVWFGHSIISAKVKVFVSHWGANRYFDKMVKKHNMIEKTL